MALRLRFRLTHHRSKRWWCLLPTVRTAAMTAALATFAVDKGIDATHRAVLVLDGAGWHASSIW